MKHLGDITKISGYEVPVVDCVIGGSPCQDLSVAGKRAGLAGARSGLYMDQIRIIKEMRENDRNNGRSGVDIRPRYMVWENVPGAFSSNKGQDFAAVLEEAIRIAEPEAPDIHVPEKGWPTAGCYMDEMGTWSVAWRVLDAQFWGTSDKPLPQRRRRIALVADFGGLSAPEILFVRESVSGHTEPSKPKRKGTAGAAESSFGAAVPCTLKIQGGCEGGGKGALIQSDKSATLSTLQDQTLFQPVECYGIGADLYNHTLTGDKAATLSANSCMTATRSGPSAIIPVPVECYSINHQGGNVEQIIPDKAGTLTAATNSSGNNKLSVAYCFDARDNGDGNVSCTLTGGHQSSISDYTSLVVEPKVYRKGTRPHAVAYLDKLVLDDQGGSQISVRMDGKSPTLRAEMHGNIPCVMTAGFCPEQSAKTRGIGYEEECPTLRAGVTPAVVCGIGSYHSNAMKSDNPHSGIYEAETARTLDALQCGYPACNQGGMAVVQPVGTYAMQTIGQYKETEIGSTLKQCDHKEAKDLVVSGVDCRNGTEYPEMIGTTQAKANGGFSLNCNQVVRVNYIVRRLTPLECERLQGFPDGWTDIGDWVDSKGKKHKAADSPRYKALGNSIALPPWKWVLKRLCACYERDATMASLFDGIGGFPYIWEQLNGKGSCLWASEIEEFPMAVTKLRFGE